MGGVLAKLKVHHPSRPVSSTRETVSKGGEKKGTHKREGSNRKTEKGELWSQFICIGALA